MSAVPKIQFGCDPELFVKNTQTGEFVTAYGLIPGDKKAPHPVPGGAIQVDGCAVEFNIDPVTTLPKWNIAITKVMDHLAKALPSEHELVLRPTVTFSSEYWASVPDAAKVIGCDPDFSAYTGQHNPRPDGNGPTRSAAGHIHIGWHGPLNLKSVDDPDHMADCFEVVKQLDAYVGVPSLLWDRDNVRRTLYGKAGACRIKPYGVEYRTPSNMWLGHQITRDYVFNASLIAIKDLFKGRVLREELGDTWAQDIIDGDGSASGFTIRKLYNAAPSLIDAELMQLHDYCKSPGNHSSLGALGCQWRIRPEFDGPNGRLPWPLPLHPHVRIR